MAIRKRRKFSPEFKADAVRLCAPSGGKTIAEVTKQFDLTETSLRAWSGAGDDRRGAHADRAVDNGGAR